MGKLDVVIIGAGVIGLAIGRALALQGREVTVIESRSSFGLETSSRNSEVIHAGIYYPKKSLKARLCLAGKAKLYKYCKERAISHSRIGKLIVAVSENEVAMLREYQYRAVQNNIRDLSYLSRDKLSELEPNLVAVAGILSPSTGIIDSHELMFNFQTDLTNHGGTVVYNSAVQDGKLTSSGPVINITGSEKCSIQCNLLINSAGLNASSVANALGLDSRHIPPTYYAKGHYFTLTGRAPFSRLIYPLANSAGLGIHVTLDMNNQARFGPDVEWVGAIDYNFDETRRGEFISAIKRYYPSLEVKDLKPGYTGIRPKVVGPSSTSADFIIQNETQHGAKGLINCFGIESPGLTASMAIAEYVERIS